MCKNPQNIYVKIGTSAKEVIDKLIKTNKDEYTLVVGGPMMGNSHSTEDVIVASNTNSILILDNENDEQSIECLRCGKCVRVCPAKISPVIIKDYIDTC